MRIGIDAHILGKGKGGVERVVHQIVSILPELLPECFFIVFTNRTYEPEFKSRANVKFLKLSISDPLIQRALILPWLVYREKLDLLHVQRAAPFFNPSRLITHTHDLLPVTAPEDHRGLRDQLVRFLTPGSLRRSDGVLTVSETVAAEIKHLYPFVKQKVKAIRNGVESDFFRPKEIDSPRSQIHQRINAQGSYALYLGAIMSRKNLEVTIKGFCEYRSSIPDVEQKDLPKLVIAGMCRSEEYDRKLRSLANQLDQEAVCFAGFVSDSECLSLLQHAAAFIAPSRGEGFDLPALEAMSCGVPVICSELPVHRELLEDDALYFETDKSESLARVLLLLNSEPALHQKLAEQGRQRASTFTWRSSMQSLATFYTQILDTSK